MVEEDNITSVEESVNLVEEKDENQVTNPIKLNFRCIYRVSLNEKDNKALEKITKEFNDLPEYEEGTPENAGEGFTDFDDDFEIKKFIVKPPMKSMKSEANIKTMRYEKPIYNEDIISKRFRYEIYTEGRTEPKLIEADIFWIKPCNILLIKGSKLASTKIDKYLSKFTNAIFNEVKFEHDFLLWILYRYDQYDGMLNINTSTDVIIEKIDKGRTHGEDTNENDIEFKEGQSRLMPFTTLYGLLINHEILHIGGDFEFRKTPKKSNKINAKLATDITMHIYADHILRGKSYGEKCGLAFPFIIEMIEIFEKWIKLPSKTKYPDDKFFDSAKESFEYQMKYSLRGIKDLKSRYSILRGNKGVQDAPT